ncbi:MAG: Uma2 family endonuclease [Bernardetiaceae bacterium]|nr:Uma2 family endonuclease [Bernardetiaceae bacterium]
MQTLNPEKLYTYSDYLTWQLDEYVELIKGKIWKMSPAPSMRHQRISGEMHRQISNFFHRQPCQVFAAPFDVRFPKQQADDNDKIYTVLQPDLCVICDRNKLDERGCVGAPDWVIEILSLGNSEREMKHKFEIYEESGVREYWILDPHQESVLAYVLEEGKFVCRRAPMIKGETVSPTIFPELTLDLGFVFETI